MCVYYGVFVVFFVFFFDFFVGFGLCDCCVGEGFGVVLIVCVDVFVMDGQFGIVYCYFVKFMFCVVGVGEFQISFCYI